MADRFWLADRVKRWIAKNRFLFTLRQKLRGKSYKFPERRITEKPWGYDRVTFSGSTLILLAVIALFAAVLLPSYVGKAIPKNWLGILQNDNAEIELNSMDDVALCHNHQKLMDFGKRIPVGEDLPIQTRVKNLENRLTIANRLSILSDARPVQAYVLRTKLESGFALHRYEILFDIPSKTKFRRLVELAEQAESHESESISTMGKLISACLYCNRLHVASNSEKDICLTKANEAIAKLSDANPSNHELVEKLVSYLNELKLNEVSKAQNCEQLSRIVNEAYAQSESSLVESAIAKLYKDL